MVEFRPGRSRAAYSAGAGFRASRGMDGQVTLWGLPEDSAPGQLAKHERDQTAIGPANQ